MVAAPQPPVERDLAALEPARPVARCIVVAEPLGHRLGSERPPPARATRRTPTARASARCRTSGRAARRAPAGRRRRGRGRPAGCSTASTVGKASRISASPSAGEAATASRHTWSTNLGPRSFQSLTSWNRYQFGAWNGSSAGPPTSCGTVPPSLRGAASPDASMVTISRSSTGIAASRSRIPPRLELREELEHRERRVEVDVDGVVERVVDAFEQREPAGVVDGRLRAADLAGLPERAAIDEEVELVEQRRAVPGRSFLVLEDRRLPALDGRPPGGCLVRARARPGPRPAGRSGPTSAYSASTSVARRRTRRSAGPRRARNGRTRRSPGARTVVAATAAPAGPAAGGSARTGGAGSRRPSVAKSRHRSVSVQGSKAARVVRVQSSSARAARASVPRSPVGAPARASPNRIPAMARPASALRVPFVPSAAETASCGRPGAIPASGPPGGSAQVARSPTVSGSGPGFSTHHSKTPTGRALRSRSPADHGRKLLADEPDAERLGLERLPGPREEGVVRPAADRAGPSPRPAGRRRAVARRTGRWRARSRPARPTNSEKPSAATGSKRCWPTSRCQRAASPRNVRPMLPVPEAADRHAGPLAVVDHRLVDPRLPDVRAGHADRPPPGDRRDRRPVELARRRVRRLAGPPLRGRSSRPSLLDPGHDHAAHERALGEEEDHDRDGHRHQGRRLDRPWARKRTAR